MKSVEIPNKIRAVEIRLIPKGNSVSSISLYDTKGIQHDLNDYKFNPKTQRYFFILEPNV